MNKTGGAKKANINDFINLLERDVNRFPQTLHFPRSLLLEKKLLAI